MHIRRLTCLISAALVAGAGCSSLNPNRMPTFADYTLDHATPVDATLQSAVAEIDAGLRQRLDIRAELTAVGVLDLQTLRLAMVRPDAIDYAASVPKIAILLAYFELNPGAATNLDARTRHELGLMIKQSDNELAAKYSQALGLKRIQQVIERYGFYDAQRGGGLWLGKHYGKSGERYGDRVANHSHAATVRQLLRFYLALEQDKLVSPEASNTMREIFASPEIPHLDDKFVKGLAGRDVHVRRKSGWWEDWFHDSAVVTGGGRHYIMVAMTHHPRGEEYLVEFARAVDELLAAR
jgi:beta-lactamase class A